MNRRRILVLSVSVLLIGGIIASVAIRHDQRHRLQNRPFADLSAGDIVSVGVCADLGFPTVTNTLDLEEQAELLALLRSVQTAACASPAPRHPIVGGTSHMFVLTLKTEEVVHLSAFSPFLLYNGQYFRADADSLNRLGDLYITHALAWLEEHT